MKELMLVAEAEFHARRMVATLATVDPAGQPRARTVIVRKLDEKRDSIWVTTDARSQKVTEIMATPLVELLFWLPHERQQFRLSCRTEIVRHGPARDDIWKELHDTNRALFLWPAPGAPWRQGADFPAKVAAAVPPPDSFVVLEMTPFEAETLELNEHPHLRRRWRAANQWQPERINP